jgi:ABC-type multidrug transport system ATPase subunit
MQEYSEMIEVSGLTRYYGGRRALEDISFETAAGTVMGVAGANGAGKSTVFDILATLDMNFRGDVRIAGENIRDSYKNIRGITGYLPGQSALYSTLTVKENIDFFASLYGADTASLGSSLLWQSLIEYSAFRVEHLSGGTRQKLAFVCAMVHSPQILLLDEPTTGIDVDARNLIWEEIRRLKGLGVTIVVSSHYFDEFEWFDSILLLHEGSQVLCGRLDVGDSLDYEEYVRDALDIFLSSGR